MSQINNTPRSASDFAIECTKVRKCGWKGMASDLVRGGPIKGIRGATQEVCPKCGNATYYKRAVE
jgi:hypothetical protein